jgi:hypothetical protein
MQDKPNCPIKKLKLPIIISLAVFLASLIAYLAVSFAIGKWNTTWLILVGGVTVATFIFSGFIISKYSKEGNFFIPRISLCISIAFAFTLIYLCLITLVDINKTWIMFLIMAIAITGADTVYSYWVNTKDRLISLVIFILVAATLEYVVLALVELLPWHPYWFIPIIGLIIAIVIVLLRYKDVLLNKKREDVLKETLEESSIENDAESPTNENEK